MRFEKNNKAAPGGRRPGAGRKKGSVKEGLADLLDQAVTPEDRKAILEVLVSRAKSGDIKAVALATPMSLPFRR